STCAPTKKIDRGISNCPKSRWRILDSYILPARSMGRDPSDQPSNRAQHPPTTNDQRLKPSFQTPLRHARSNIMDLWNKKSTSRKVPKPNRPVSLPSPNPEP